MNLSEWVREARRHAKLTQEQLAERLSMTKGNISGWENGRHAPSFDQTITISRITGFPIEGHQAREADTSVPELKRVPVVGTAKMGDDGFYEEISAIPGAGDGHIEIATSDPNAYGLRCRGMSMFPAIRDGWYAIVEPNRKPAVSEYVLIKLKDGRRMVKELLFERPNGYEVMSVNEAVRFTVEKGELESIQAIGPIVPPSAWRPD